MNGGSFQDSSIHLLFYFGLGGSITDTHALALQAAAPQSRVPGQQQKVPKLPSIIVPFFSGALE